MRAVDSKLSDKCVRLQGMAKSAPAAEPSPFTCTRCGTGFITMRPACRECGSWDTVQETSGSPSKASHVLHLVGKKGKQRSRDISTMTKREGFERFSTETPALDRLLGGGLVRGKIFLVSGLPGAGKSTLLLRVAADLTKSRKVLYAASEEGEEDIFDRAERIDAVRENLRLFSTQNFSEIESEVKSTRPDILFIDSINVLANENVMEMKRLTELTMRLVRRTGRKLVVFVVGHVTKGQDIAGPMSMQHMFDATLFLEGAGDELTIVRTKKNRMGPLASALFEMTSRGMEAIENPSERFLSHRVPGRPGSVISAVCDGKSGIARTNLFEVQSLVGKPKPQGQVCRSATGIPKERFAQILALLDSSMEEAFPQFAAALSICDVRVNIPGGLLVTEPSADLAVALAIASSRMEIPVDPKLMVFGEIGLAGEVRGVPRSEARIDEAQSMGFRKAIAARGAAVKKGKFQTLEVTMLADALEAALPGGSSKRTALGETKKTKKRSAA